MWSRFSCALGDNGWLLPPFFSLSEVIFNFLWMPLACPYNSSSSHSFQLGRCYCLWSGFASSRILFCSRDIVIEHNSIIICLPMNTLLVFFSFADNRVTMVSTAKIILVLLIIVLIDLAQARLSEVPRKHIDWCWCSSGGGVCCFLAPPQRPERFHSREELKRYLQKVCSFLRSNCIGDVSVSPRFMSIILSWVDGVFDVSIRNIRLFLWTRMLTKTLVRNISETISPPCITSWHNDDDYWSATSTSSYSNLIQSFVNGLIPHEVQ